VTVVGQTPLPGLEQPLSHIAAPVQTSTARDIEQSMALDISAFMNRRLNGVRERNPEQSVPAGCELSRLYGLSAPGTPQGLSVYFDGVRINQPFGDVVSWDLIPARRLHR
jgi:hypothetical protein